MGKEGLFMNEAQIKQMIGELFIANYQLQQTVKQLTAELQKLRKEAESKPAEGSKL